LKNHDVNIQQCSSVTLLPTQMSHYLCTCIVN